jgi:hypothetical protein
MKSQGPTPKNESRKQHDGEKQEAGKWKWASSITICKCTVVEKSKQSSRKRLGALENKRKKCHLLILLHNLFIKRGLVLRF